MISSCFNTQSIIYVNYTFLKPPACHNRIRGGISLLDDAAISDDLTSEDSVSDDDMERNTSQFT